MPGIVKSGPPYLLLMPSLLSGKEFQFVSPRYYLDLEKEMLNKGIIIVK